MTLKNSMFTVTGGTPDKVAVRLNDDHEIYQAHFPGKIHQKRNWDISHILSC